MKGTDERRGAAHRYTRRVGLPNDAGMEPLSWFLYRNLQGFVGAQCAGFGSCCDGILACQRGAHSCCRLARLPSVAGMVPLSWLLSRRLCDRRQAIARKGAAGFLVGGFF